MKANSFFKIDNKTVGKNHPVYFIADIAANHDGDIERAKDLIFLAAEAGADAAKFQHFQASTIVSDHGFKTLGGAQSHQASWEKSVFEVYQDVSVNPEWSSVLKKTCEQAGITFFTSPYSIDLVEHIDPYVPAYKIGSGDITWIEIIEYIANKNKPYILAAGASNMEDVERAVRAGLAINPNLCLMQCNTNYTASLENFKNIQLNVLKVFSEMYPNLVLGLSDHTPGHATVLGAVALGARMIEKHFTDDNNRQGPDHKFSMTPSSWKDMVSRTRELENALGNGVKRVEDNEKETVILQRRAIRLAKDMHSGERIQSQDLVLLRPCPVDALPPYLMSEVIDKKARVSISAGDYVRWEDIE
ncbi:N-acetylneuraminate synthase family protein [Halomonas sp. IOP_14]|uniref:N-acetylneuraminate synthase family protein n=1 Tax=Halomonas sp. IOP_14 TaxID=2873295 RepID=UPI001E354084|nr:N-acetylneuraminate synthase family protein [Halomonas sp. IOP_14]MCD1588409.1 N-acetylneuraminate synthase family protein [Halomonas sp. IOP_14]